MKPPFDDISLCLSGGGFRSAAYALGVLKYLDRIELLQSVKSISTVSGGSITGIKYVDWLSSGGQNFVDFYDILYHYLSQNNLHNKAVSILNDAAIWEDERYLHKDRNLINSFAIAYDDFFEGRTIGDLNLEKSHLEEYIFNATDMTEALQFRFKNRRVFGNKAFQDKMEGKASKEWIKSIKLGDILAASSCFPGGFEPIIFPDDFLNKTVSAGLPKVPLIDGGVVNNQGLDDFLIRKKIGPTLLFLADVESYKIANPFERVISGRFIDIFTKITSGATTLILVLFAILMFLLFGHNLFGLITTIVLSSLAFFLAILQVSIYYLLQSAGEKIGLKDLLIFHPRRYGVYIINRLTSFKSLAESIFLKNNRRKSLDYLYFKLSKEKGALPILCPIYRLTSTQESEIENWHYINEQLGDPYPSVKMLETVTMAANFGTTLWFNEKDRESVLKALVKTGEMTACYSILVYLLGAERKGVINTSHFSFFEKLKSDWKSFQNE